MSKSKITVFFIGVGPTARACVRALRERRVPIVGAVARRHHIGEDLGELAGCGPIGVTVSPAGLLPELLDETRPDIVLDMSGSNVPQIFPNAETCMEHGANYMSVGEQCYAPFASDPELAARLEQVALEHGATYLGSGSGDVWQLLPTSLTACSQNVRKVTWEFGALLDEFGIQGARACGIGEPRERWRPYLEMESAPSTELVMRQIVGQLGLTETGRECRVLPIPAPRELEYPQIPITVKEGALLGHDEVVTVRTREGVVVQGTIHVKCSEPGEENSLVCRVEGTPDLQVVVENFHGEVSTSTIMVNRIPDVVCARPGILTANDLPPVSYKAESAFWIGE